MELTSLLTSEEMEAQKDEMSESGSQNESVIKAKKKKKKEQQRMRWLDGIIDSMDMLLSCLSHVQLCATP